jgi:hypothetical protein
MSDHVREISIALPSPDVELGGWASPWRRLLPMWRHVVWMGGCFVIAAVAVAVRVDVQDLRKDVERTQDMQKEALLLHERLQLEVDARHRAAAVEAMATELAIVTPASVEIIR